MLFRCCSDVVPISFQCGSTFVLTLVRFSSDVVPFLFLFLYDFVPSPRHPPPPTSLSPAGGSYRYIIFFSTGREAPRNLREFVSIPSARCRETFAVVFSTWHEAPRNHREFLFLLPGARRREKTSARYFLYYRARGNEKPPHVFLTNGRKAPRNLRECR